MTSIGANAFLAPTNEFSVPRLEPRHDHVNKPVPNNPNFFAKPFGARRHQRDLNEVELDALKGIFDVQQLTVLKEARSFIY